MQYETHGYRYLRAHHAPVWAAAPSAQDEAEADVYKRQAVTGYVRGGCSPIGLKRPFPVIFDEKMCIRDSLSSYARQFLGQMDKPDLDSIDGLSCKLCSRAPLMTMDESDMDGPYLKWNRI